MHKLIRAANGIDLDSLLKLLGAKSIHIHSGLCAKLEQESRDYDEEDRHKEWFCEISWGGPEEYDSHTREWTEIDTKDGVDFSTHASGDTSKDAIVNSIHVFIDRWFCARGGLREQEKQIIIRQGFDPELLKT